MLIEGSVPAGRSKLAASMFGFFSIRIAIDSVFGIALVTPIGTTAPFSAMSGVDTNAMSLLCAGAAAAERLHRLVHRLGLERALVPRLRRRVAGFEPARRGEQREQRDAAAGLQHFPA